MSKPYIYNFRVSGEYEAEIKTWLQHQSKKSESLQLAVMRAIHQYGATTDINKLKTQAFIENNNNFTDKNQNTTQQQTLKVEPTQTVTTKTNDVEPPKEPTSFTKPKNSNPSPDFGFLSK